MQATTISTNDLILPHITNTITRGNYARYDLEPLEPGYGFTLGTALKRVLLSSLPGAAITTVSIEGVRDGSQVLASVEETVAELALNLKQLRLRVFSDIPVSLRLEATGAREVTAADLVGPTTVQIVNPELHLATLTDKDAHLVMELVAEQGRGYYPVETNEMAANGVIALDATFTPVQRVTTTLERTRLGQITTFEKLTVELWMDGTVEPDEALRQAGTILVGAFTPFLLYAQRGQPDERRASSSGILIPPEIANMPIEDLALSVRTYNALKRNGIITLGRLLEMSGEDLRGLRNVGEKSLEELHERLMKHGAFPPSQQWGDDLQEE